MRRKNLLAFLAPLVWLGCNALLGIDDASFVPLRDAAAGPSGDAGAFGPTGPLRPARSAVRLPVGEVRTLDVQIVPDPDAGITGAAVLAAFPGDPAITATVTELETNRFAVRLVAPASVTDLLDTALRLEATNRDGSSRVTANVRLLVGVPGTLDTTFGTSGHVVLQSVGGTSSPVSFPIALLGTTALIGDGTGKLFLLEDEGNAPRELDVVGNGCEIDSLATNANAILFGGRCPGDRGAYGEIAPSAPDASAPPLDVGEVVHAVTYKDAAVVLAGNGRGVLSSAVLTTAVLDGGAPASLFPVDAGVVALGTRNVAGGAELALEYVPLLTPEPGASRRFVRDEPDAGAVELAAAGVHLGGDTFAAAWTVTYASGPEHDVGYVYVLGLDGSTRGALRFPAFSARVAADEHGRVVLVSDAPSLTDMTVRRLVADAGVDPTFPPVASTCHFPAVAIDPDGMIVVACENDQDSSALVSRYWP